MRPTTRRTFLRRCTGAAATLAASSLGFGTDAVAARHRSWADTRAHNRKILDGLMRLKVPMLRWEWVVIHHTATEWSNVASIDRLHGHRFDDRLGTQYHFLINNGNNKPEGFIELARWRFQARAIHLFHEELAPNAVAVSLVGNFQKRRPGRRQVAVAEQLTRRLVAQLGIDADHVVTHRQIDDGMTTCPGKHFPTAAFMKPVGRPDG